MAGVLCGIPSRVKMNVDRTGGNADLVLRKGGRMTLTGVPQVAEQASSYQRLVVTHHGKLGLAEGRQLADLLHSLPSARRSGDVLLPHAEQLPMTALAALVFFARRLRATGGDVCIVAGPPVAKTIARHRLS
jgi:hypothetical protein